MLYAVECFLVALLTSVWTVFVAFMVYINDDELIRKDVPLLLPNVALAWTVGALVMIFLWRSQTDNPINTLSLGGTTWYAAGWTYGLLFFGIPIDTFWKYVIIVNYQITRTILGSLLSNVFTPFLVANVQNKAIHKTLDGRQTFKILLALNAVNLFGFVATLTDIILYFAQIDVALISLGIKMISDTVSTYGVLESSLKGNLKDYARIADKLNDEAPDTKPLALRSGNARRRDADDSKCGSRYCSAAPLVLDL